MKQTNENRIYLLCYEKVRLMNSYAECCTLQLKHAHIILMMEKPPEPNISGDDKNSLTIIQ